MYSVTSLIVYCILPMGCCCSTGFSVFMKLRLPVHFQHKATRLYCIVLSEATRFFKKKAWRQTFGIIECTYDISTYLPLKSSSDGEANNHKFSLFKTSAFATALTYGLAFATVFLHYRTFLLFSLYVPTFFYIFYVSAAQCTLIFVWCCFLLLYTFCISFIFYLKNLKTKLVILIFHQNNFRQAEDSTDQGSWQNDRKVIFSKYQPKNSNFSCFGQLMSPML